MLSILSSNKYSARELVRELISECSKSEQLRLLAWANAPRMDSIIMEDLYKGRLSEINDDKGPDIKDKELLTYAVGA